MHLSFVYTTLGGPGKPAGIWHFGNFFVKFSTLKHNLLVKTPGGRGKLAKICINNLNQRSIIYTILKEYNSQISHVEKI